MFGYRLVKNVEMENLKSNLVEFKLIVDKQENRINELLNQIKKQEQQVADLLGKIEEQKAHIAELQGKFKEQESTVVNLTGIVKDTNERIDEKPIKKVRRKSTKKITKKED